MKRRSLTAGLFLAALAAGFAAPTKEGSASDRALQEAIVPKKKQRPMRDGDVIGRLHRGQRHNPKRQARRRLERTHLALTGERMSGRRWVKVRKLVSRQRRAATLKAAA